jgi:hypothetical protein
MRVSTHALVNPDKPPIEGGWRCIGRWGSALQHVFILHLPQSQAINKFTGNTVGCVLARIHTSSDACQHALGHAWCICVPARIHLAIQTSLQESVVGEERDDGGARCSMCLYSTHRNLKLSADGESETTRS